MHMPLMLRRAIRSLARYPGITALAVVALAMGIGLPAAMFSIMDAAALRGLPVADAGRLMHLERRRLGTHGEGAGVAPRDYIAWQAQKSFEALGAYQTGTVTLRVDQSVDRWEAGYLTPEVWTMLGTRPTVGRTFTSSDVLPGAPPPVVLSDHVWRDRFNRDKSLLGRVVSIDGVSHTLIGVMPANFRFPIEADLWVPLFIPTSAVDDATFQQFDVLGKLRDGVQRETALSEFSVIASRVAATYPATNKDIGITVKPYTERYMGESAMSTLYVMMGAVLLVLLIACANVTNLLLVRAIHRSREVAISMALGASRLRIVGQVLTESALIAVIGGVLGIGLAQIGISGLSGLLRNRLPYWAEPRLDASVLAFAMVLTGAAALFAGLLPALRSTKGNLSNALREDSRGSTSARSGRVMKGLVIVELALSMGLLVATGLMAVSVRKAANVDLGFATSSLFTARVATPTALTPQERGQVLIALEQRLQSMPSVGGAGLISDLPGTHAPARRVAMDGVAYESRNAMPVARFAAASPEFFSTISTRASRGRLFNSTDNAAGLPVALVNARFVAKYSPHADVLGQRIRLGAGDSTWRTIVGVVPDLWMGAFDASPDRNPAGVYVPLAQSDVNEVSIVANVKSGPPLSITNEVRAAVFAVNRDVPIYDVQNVPQLVEAGTWFYGMGATVLAACGAAALLLAFVGVYGVVAFSVGRRRREFGVRMALGANPREIIQLVLRGGFAPVMVGLGLGIGLAMLLANGVASLLFGVSPSNMFVFSGVALALAVIAGTAMFVPALRASRAQPSDALRAD